MHRIEDDIRDDWIKDWAESGVEKIERSLESYWAFGDFLIEHGLDDTGASTEIPLVTAPKKMEPVVGGTTLETIVTPRESAATLFTQIER